MIKPILKILMLCLLIAVALNQHKWIQYIHPNESFFKILLTFLLFAVSANVAVMLLSWIYRRRKGLLFNQIDNVVLGLENLYYILVTISFVVASFAFFGIPPEKLLTSISIVAAAMAIIFKDFIIEIISGIIISFSRDVSIDDYIKIGDHKGKIIDLTISKVALLNEDDDVIYIPNNKFVSGEVVNYTKREIRKVNIEFEVDIHSFNTIEELEADLINALMDYHDHISVDSFYLRIVDVRKDSLDLKFQYVVHRRDRELEREIRKKTVRRVVNYVKNNLSGKEKNP